MNDELNIFDKYVVSGILALNEYKIKEVISLESINSLYWENEEYSEILILIKKGDINAIKLFENKQPNEGHFLEVMTFKSENNNNYIVTIYDNLELNQDPQIIDIFPI